MLYLVLSIPVYHPLDMKAPLPHHVDLCLSVDSGYGQSVILHQMLVYVHFQYYRHDENINCWVLAGPYQLIIISLSLITIIIIISHSY